MQVYIALGANLGDRDAAMHQAIEALDERIGPLVKCSSFYETAPVDFDSEHLFLNAVALFETALPPMALLEETQAIEREMGRTRKSHNGVHYDRCIDIDLLLLGDTVVTSPRLVLPHPHLHERTFVLQPLAEIAPGLVHPVLKKTMDELSRALTSHKIG